MTESVFKPHGSGHHCKNAVFCGLLLSLNSFKTNKWRWAICICFNSEKVAILDLGEKKSLSFLFPRTKKKKKDSLLFFFLVNTGQALFRGSCSPTPIIIQLITFAFPVGNKHV